MRGSSLSTSLPTLCSSSLFIIAILVGGECYLIVISVRVSPVTSEVEHFFMCLLAIYIFSLEKCLLRSFAKNKKDPLPIFKKHFASFNWVICLFIIELQKDFIYSRYKFPYQIYDLQIFYPILGGYLFTFLMFSFEAEVFNFDKV